MRNLQTEIFVESFEFLTYDAQSRDDGKEGDWRSDHSLIVSAIFNPLRY